MAADRRPGSGDPAELVARVSEAKREVLLRVHRHRLGFEDLEDCFSQATLELVSRPRTRARAFVSEAHVALASPPFGFHPTNLVDEAELKAPVHVNSDRIKFKTKDPVDVRVQTVTFDPHGFSGWHHHPGIVIVAVKSGTLTVLDADCNASTYGPGQPSGSVFVESGDEPGEVRNLTNEPATVYATFVAPDADPPVFRIEDAPVSCP